VYCYAAVGKIFVSYIASGGPFSVAELLVVATSCSIGNGVAALLKYSKTKARANISKTSVGWQVTLCDPIWHVSSRSGVAG